MSSMSVGNCLPVSKILDDAAGNPDVGPPAFPGDDEAPEIRLRLIATSDLHACLLPYDYCHDRPLPGRSLARIAAVIAHARAEVPNSLLFDNGDFLQGNPLADYVANARRRRRPHPVITAFNALRYDAVTLGNHEFNYGLNFLTAALSHADFPVVSANIVTRLGSSPARDRTFVPPFTIMRRRLTDASGRAQTLRIGVIGFAPPQIEIWDRDHLGGRIRMRDIIAAAQAWLPRLRTRGADVIVALAHSGIGPLDAVEGMENAATALAALPDIDAVIAGHSHVEFPGPAVAAAAAVDPVRGLLAGKPAVMPGHCGSHVGIIDLTLARAIEGRRRWRVTAASARLVEGSAGAMPAAPQLRRAISADHRAALAWSRRIIGHSRTPLHTHFATTAPSAALDLIAVAKTDHVRQALAGTRWADLPILASATPFRSGGRGGAGNFTDIPAGPLQRRNLSDLYTFPNTIVAMVMRGACIADWLEQSAALFRQIAPGDTDMPLHDTSVPSFTFETIPALTYAIDLSQPARFDADGRLIHPEARRILGLRLDGLPLDPDQPVVLVTNNHRASRAISVRPGCPPEIVLSAGTRTQDVLAGYIRRQGTVGAPPARSWHFLPMPGTTLRITAGPGSASYLGDIAAYRPVPIGTGPDGFAHYRLHL
ncbi:bifunctional 2',3'-cyclic-nucleotide 2'-phosphodiesterase/3'-nucleotidase [Tabrizicola caldifontis]|uniref:bifunctional 2',3'-cyclic-nucleotide 2'-phosphodiesterase/3'-nucleotidase n=1 Tax=Tabrizicola caldifontis TaxID=2528036 RepID=UPI0010811F53|nr:bifunctional 2',3'-cyclic-nucleotide 2'-phosphodiesterase/3'-nucleotidase [Rhodobacter sp. YIM 73028]